ncbi:MAG: YggS family pyridoxal phosphate-dependent enzyme [Telmatospirillum sp.]|nr:YggS family pyridoxal phosphate-dependent enzyme [Telmatospirillum sp.]
MMDSIADRLLATRAKIAAAGPQQVTLVAVAKTYPASDVEQALAAGQIVFGENRVQEAMAKYPPLRAHHANLELHLIGPLQTNKVKEAVATFDVIQTLDRPKLAAALATEFARTPKRPRLFVQVNTGAEPQKAGILPEAADAFIAECQNQHRLAIAGLMCIPPADEPPAPHFALLAEIAARNGLALLSMGMSADYETAVALGATHVRIGSAIFGARAPAPG